MVEKREDAIGQVIWEKEKVPGYAAGVFAAEPNPRSLRQVTCLSPSPHPDFLTSDSRPSTCAWGCSTSERTPCSGSP